MRELKKRQLKEREREVKRRERALEKERAERAEQAQLRKEEEAVQLQASAAPPHLARKGLGGGSGAASELRLNPKP